LVLLSRSITYNSYVIIPTSRTTYTFYISTVDNVTISFSTETIRRLSFEKAYVTNVTSILDAVNNRQDRQRTYIDATIFHSLTWSSVSFHLYRIPSRYYRVSWKMEKPVNNGETHRAWRSDTTTRQYMLDNNMARYNVNPSTVLRSNNNHSGFSRRRRIIRIICLSLHACLYPTADGSPFYMSMCKPIEGTGIPRGEKMRDRAGYGAQFLFGFTEIIIILDMHDPMNKAYEQGLSNLLIGYRTERSDNLSILQPINKLENLVVRHMKYRPKCDPRERESI